MGQLFNTKGSQYDDDGNLLVNPVTAIEQSSFTHSVGTNASGAISSIYDNSTSTSYSICIDEGMGSHYYLKWDMKQKQTFKSIYVYGSALSSNSTNVTVALQGSDNGSSWTTIDSFTTSNTVAQYFNLVGTDQRYKQFRLYTTHEDGNADIEIITIKGVL